MWASLNARTRVAPMEDVTELSDICEPAQQEVLGADTGVIKPDGKPLLLDGWHISQGLGTRRAAKRHRLHHAAV